MDAAQFVKLIFIQKDNKLKQQQISLDNTREQDQCTHLLRSLWVTRSCSQSQWFQGEGEVASSLQDQQTTVRNLS